MATEQPISAETNIQLPFIEGSEIQRLELSDRFIAVSAAIAKLEVARCALLLEPPEELAQNHGFVTLSKFPEATLQRAPRADSEVFDFWISKSGRVGTGVRYGILLGKNACISIMSTEVNTKQQVDIQSSMQQLLDGSADKDAETREFIRLSDIAHTFVSKEIIQRIRLSQFSKQVNR